MSFLEKKRRGLLGVTRHVRGSVANVTFDAAKDTPTVSFAQAYDDPISITFLYGNCTAKDCDYPAYQLTLPLFQSISFGGLYADSGPATTWYIDAEGDYYYTFYDYGFYFDTHGYGTPTYILNTVETVIYLKDDIGTKPIDITVSRVKKTEADISQMTKVFTVEKTETVQIRGSCYALLGDKYGVFDLTDDAAANEVLVFDSFLKTFRREGSESTYPYTTQSEAPASGLDLSFVTPEVNTVYLKQMIPAGGDVVSHTTRQNKEIEKVLFSLPVLRCLPSQTGCFDHLYSLCDRYFVERYIGEITLLGTEEDLTLENGVFTLPITNAVNPASCTHLSIGNTDTADNCFQIKANKLLIRHDSTPDLASFKSWLQAHRSLGHTFTLWYMLAEPTEEALSISPTPEFGYSQWTFSLTPPAALSFSYSTYNFSDIRRIVRNGLAKKYFSVGDQITCKKTQTNGNRTNTVTLVWDIIGFDKDIPTETALTHSMTLQLHQCYTKMPFDTRGSTSWADSSIRAYLNGTKEGDFMADIDPNFLSILGEVKKSTKRILGYDDKHHPTEYENVETKDTMFLISVEEAYAEKDGQTPLYEYYQCTDRECYLKNRMDSKGEQVTWYSRDVSPATETVEESMKVFVYYGDNPIGGLSPKKDAGISPLCCIV